VYEERKYFPLADDGINAPAFTPRMVGQYHGPYTPDRTDVAYLLRYGTPVITLPRGSPLAAPIPIYPAFKKTNFDGMGISW
jgi:hypothetical protein